MSKASKTTILTRFAANLHAHRPELREHFLCPTCLTVIPLQEKHRISEAHIIPKAAGGTAETYLGKKCNDRFGSRQDKWLGEWVRLAKDPARSLLSTKIKDGHFWIDEMKVNGSWERDQKGELFFHIHGPQNAPATITAIEQKFAARPWRVNVRVSLPLLRQQRMSMVGFLTAGYLMWFKALGYSWVLQPHLDPVREQIMHPEKDILGTSFFVFAEGQRWQPWIGLLSFEDELALTVGLDNVLVFFPPVDRPHLYSTLGRLSEIPSPTIRTFQYPSRPYVGPAVHVAFKNRLLVSPDTEGSGRCQPIFLYLTEDMKAHRLYPISEERFQQIAQLPDVEHLSFEMPDGARK
jgi:hypothetical protein